VRCSSAPDNSFAFLPQFLRAPVGAGYGFGSTVTEAGLLILVGSPAAAVKV
jgi:hypothetical protein